MKKIFLLIFFAQLIFFVCIPPFQIPDEPGHYENVFWAAKGKYPFELLKKTQEFPHYTKEIEDVYFIKKDPPLFSVKKLINNPLKNKKQTEFEKKFLKKKNFYPINFQAYHPFLYYFLISPSQILADFLNLDIITRFYLTRFFSLIFSSFTFFLVYQILKLLKIEDENKKTIFLFFGLNPLILCMSIGINPDNGVALFSYLNLFLTLFFIKRRIFLNNMSLFILGLISGLAFISKTSGIFNLLFIFLILLFQKKGKKIFYLFKKTTLLFFSFLIPTSIWIILRITRYHYLMTPAFFVGHYKPLYPKNFLVSLFSALFEFRHTIFHFSGFFGATNNFWPPKIYFSSYFFLVVFFFILGIKDLYKKFFPLTLYLLSCFLFFYSLSLYFKINGLSWDIQGRYLILAWLPFYFFVFFGIKKILKEKANTIVNIFSLVNFFAFLFFLLIPRFYPSKNFIDDLNIVYPFFGYFFILFLFVSFIIINKLFKPNSKY